MFVFSFINWKGFESRQLVRANFSTFRAKALHQELILYFHSALARSIAISRQADIVAAMTLDCLKGTSRAFDSRIHKLRPHKGQITVAQRMRALLHSEFHPSKIAGRYFSVLYIALSGPNFIKGKIFRLSKENYAR